MKTHRATGYREETLVVSPYRAERFSSMYLTRPKL